MYKFVFSPLILGKICQKWSAQTPFTHAYSPTESNIDKGIGDHNYCRNPDGHRDQIWCYTTDSTKEYEFCNPVPKESIYKLLQFIEDK